MSSKQRYLILPARGLQAVANNASAAAGATLLQMAHSAGAKSLRTTLRAIVASADKKVGKKLKPAATKLFDVIDSINENGVKLVDATPDMIAALRFEQPGLRAVPEVFYRPARVIIEIENRLAKAAATAVAKKLTVTVLNAQTQAPVKGVSIVGFTDFDARTGTSGITKNNGTVTLTVTGATKYERLYAQHDLPGLWSFLQKNVTTNGALTIELAPVDLAAVDSLRHFHTIGGATSGAGVRVGVIDSGVDASHPDLQVAGGLGCVPGSPETDFGPSGSHGTHVAGIIAGRGQRPAAWGASRPGRRSSRTACSTTRPTPVRASAWSKRFARGSSMAATFST